MIVTLALILLFFPYQTLEIFITIIITFIIEYSIMGYLEG